VPLALGDRIEVLATRALVLEHIAVEQALSVTHAVTPRQGHKVHYGKQGSPAGLVGGFWMPVAGSWVAKDRVKVNGVQIIGAVRIESTTAVVRILEGASSATIKRVVEVARWLQPPPSRRGSPVRSRRPR
jgi:hypothetical protein